MLRGKDGERKTLDCTSIIRTGQLTQNGHLNPPRLLLDDVRKTLDFTCIVVRTGQQALAEYSNPSCFFSLEQAPFRTLITWTYSVRLTGALSCAGGGEMHHTQWLVAACAAAGASREAALDKRALLLQLDPTAVVAVQLQGVATLSSSGGH